MVTGAGVMVTGAGVKWTVLVLVVISIWKAVTTLVETGQSGHDGPPPLFLRLTRLKEAEEVLARALMVSSVVKVKGPMVNKTSDA